MLNKLLFKSNTLEKALDASWLRNEVISQNVANVDTPNYKRKDVKFDAMLDSELKKSRIAKGQTNIDGGGINVINDPANTSYRLDGNNVDIEYEMAQMAMNTLRYNTLIQRMNGQFSKLKTVIRGGK